MNRHRNEGILNGIVTSPTTVNVCLSGWTRVQHLSSAQMMVDHWSTIIWARLVHHSFLPNDTTVTTGVYCQELQPIMEKLLDWKGYSTSININGEYITHLRFADDIAIFAELLEDFSIMLEDLNRVSQQDDLGAILVCSGYAHGMMTSRLIDRPCGVGFLDLSLYTKFLTCGVDDSRDVIDHEEFMSFDFSTTKIATPSLMTAPPNVTASDS